MPNVTAEEARHHFDQVLDDAQRDPVFVFADGKPSAVVLSWDAFKTVIERRQQSGVRPRVEELLAQSIERHRNLFTALSKLD